MCLFLNVDGEKLSNLKKNASECWNVSNVGNVVDDKNVQSINTPSEC